MRCCESKHCFFLFLLLFFFLSFLSFSNVDSHARTRTHAHAVLPLPPQVLMSGYGLARNSSKVMAPPGGYCSDIFGTATQNVEPPSAAQRTRNESTVFRSPARIPTAEHSVQAAARRGQSQVFSQVAPSPVRTARGMSVVCAATQHESSALPTSAASPARVRPEAMQFEQMAQEVRTDVHSSTRVVQPPGGQ